MNNHPHLSARTWRAGILAGAVVLATAACGSSAKSTAAAPPSTAAATPTTASAPPTTALSTPTTAGSAGSDALKAALAKVGAAAPSSFTVSLAKGPQGIFLVGPDGHALYFRTTDQGTTSSCTASCAANWPALTSTGAPTANTGVTKAALGTANGQVPNQVTYYGHLLYFFNGDTAPGQTNGVGKPNWFLLGPVGNQMAPR